MTNYYTKRGTSVGINDELNAECIAEVIRIHTQKDAIHAFKVKRINEIHKLLITLGLAVQAKQSRKLGDSKGKPTEYTLLRLSHRGTSLANEILVPQRSVFAALRANQNVKTEVAVDYTPLPPNSYI